MTDLPGSFQRPGAVPADDLPGLDLVALRGHLAGRLPLAGELSGQLLSGGRSNLTYQVTDGVRDWVLRRPPLGHVLETAHDMTREYRVISALAPTAVPVPGAVLLCEDPAVIGAPFYLMERVPGVIYRRDDQLAAVSEKDAVRLADALVDGLAELHLLDPAAVGLADFGRPDGYLQRQVRRWGRQLAASHSRDVPGFEDLSTRLAARVPADPDPAGGGPDPAGRGTGLVHGDYRLDNVIVAADDPGVIRAVLDWEMATLGDPLTDLAMLVMFWDGMAGVGDVITATPAGHQAFPPRSHLLDRYADRTGFRLDRFAWYLGFAYYKLAVILEGIHYRDTLGRTVGEGFDRIGAMVPVLVERGRAALDPAIKE